MEVTDLKQGSDAWLSLRRTKITASEIAKILQISPYGTKLDLYNEKVEGKEFVTTPQMLAGHEAEIEIRAWYESKIGEAFIPTVMVNDIFLASLDGITFDNEKILECKLCNKEVFAMAEKGEVVPHYMSQIQMQLYCCPEAREAHYVCYNAGKYAVVIVERDEEYMEKMIVAGREFYDNHLIPKIPPSPSEKDYVVLNDDEACLIAVELQNEMLVRKESEKREKALKQRLFEFTDDGNCIVGCLRLTRTSRESVDYKKACVDNGIDLESYKKNSIGYYTIREMKKVKD